MTTLTTDEVAALVGVTPQAVRTWVMRGDLEPVRRGAKPLRFDQDQVVEMVLARTTPARRAWLARMSVTLGTGQPPVDL